MSSFRVITRNILSNWAAYSLQIVIAFLLTPFILREIGDARYGVWAIVVSVTGYYGLLDLGLRAGMTQYITRYFSTGDMARMNMAASSGFALHAGCAICVGLFTVVAASVAPTYLSLSTEFEAEAVSCLLVVGFSTAIQFLLFPFSVALTAKQRFDIVTAISGFSRLLSAVAMVCSLLVGYGLIGLCVAGALGNILDYLLRWAVAHRILPELKVSLRLINWASCRECLVFGSWSAVISASTLVISFTDALVIGFFMPVSAIAFFTLANNLIKYFANLFVPVGHVFYPAATALDARDDVAGLRRLYLTASRMITLQATSIALITCFWAGDFYSLWIGQEYLSSSVYHSVPLLFRVLLVGAVCTAAQRIGSKILLGRRQTRGLAWLFVAEGTLNLVISIALIGKYGLLGVAIGTVIPAVLCQGVLHPLMVCSNLRLSWSDYARGVIWPTAAVVAILVPLLSVLRGVMYHDGWANLFLAGAIASMFAMVVIALFGLTPADRQQYLYPSARRILHLRPFSFDPLGLTAPHQVSISHTHKQHQQTP